MITRERLYRLLNDPDSGRAAALVNTGLFVLIILNIIAMVMETVASVRARFDGLFWWFEVFSVAIFSAEYVARLWSCTASPQFRGPVAGRARWALTPLAMVDLLAVLPFYLPFLGVDLRVLRILRVLRLARIAKLGRYSHAAGVIGQVLRRERQALTASLAFVLVLLLIAASLMYYAESEAQPEEFGSIPDAMWWAVVTLTTVGYGDVYPVTPVGRMLGAVIAVLGIGVVALPTGILGAGFVEGLKRDDRPCPHCGRKASEQGEGHGAAGGG